MNNSLVANYSLDLLEYLKFLVQIHESIVQRKPLVTLTRASSAVGAIHAFFAIFAWTSRSSTLFHFAGMVEDAMCLFVERVHLVKYSVLALRMACTTNVEVFVQELLATITVHVYTAIISYVGGEEFKLSL